MKSGVSAAWLALLLSLLIGLPREAGADETVRSRNPVGPSRVLPKGGIGFLESARGWSAVSGPNGAGCPSSSRKGFRRAGEGRRSLTAPTVEFVRTSGRNYLYKASFTPADPPATFWEGHLEAFSIHEDGTMTARWDAGDGLRRTPAADRVLFAGHTADGLSWSRMDFHKDAITPGMLGVPTAAERDAIVDYVRGVGRDDDAKLGDVLHSKAVVVGPPSRFFFDEGYSIGVPAGEKSFADAKATRKRIVYVGTNDGMLHAFLGGTHDPTTGLYDAGTGEEMFGYVPFHILHDLVGYVPGERTSHRYYVDSSPRAADVWIDENGDGTKQSSEWRTVLIGGLRGGGNAYFALDVTDPPPGTDYGDYPRVLWEYRNPSVVGETWSEPFIGKIRMQESSWSTPRDRWVAILGGGRPDAGTAGASFIVMDIATGRPLKIIRRGIDNAIAASPTAVLDGNGYIKFAYAADLDGSVYKVDFRNVGLRSDGFSAWDSRKIFQASPGQPVYHRVEPASVTESSRYLFFGTGDQKFPDSATGTGKFYAIQDTDSFWPATGSPLTEGSLKDLSSRITSLSGGTAGASRHGWFVNFAAVPSTADDPYPHRGEKVLSDPVIFHHNVFFTTFAPDPTDPCGRDGVARIYGLRMTSAGAGLDALASRGETSFPKVPCHVYAGSEGGVPSSPSLSIRPSGRSSIFVGFSTTVVIEIGIDSPPHMKTIRSWRETF